LRCGIGEGDKLVLGAIGKMTGGDTSPRPYVQSGRIKKPDIGDRVGNDESKNAGNEIAAYPTLLIV